MKYLKIIAFAGDSHTWGQGGGISFDWDPVVCGGDLKTAIKEMRAMTDKILMHTVSPIGGDQLNLRGLDYNDYVEAARQVAKEENLPLVDCYKVFKEEEKRVHAHRRYEFIFSDDWHPPQP